MKQSVTTLALGCCLMHSVVNAFAPSGPQRSAMQQSKSSALKMWVPDDASTLSHSLEHASTLISTIDSDIASIPDDEFRKVFAGGGLIMFGSVLSTIFVGFLVESGGGGYADLVAETYAEQDFDSLDSMGLSAEQKKETEEMLRSFREKKMRKAGTWTEEDEEKKQQLIEEKDMFSDYD
mmetsp:Transcript_21802/g.31216  ORF Transcript_21802/g.31216 Transcript_21802/m.31216 type:complete len:179 (+) Transcript_21802:16-552(+)